jgi:hypothetical protein
MKLSFREAAIAGSSICFALAAIWIGAPQFILWIWQIDGSEPALLMARRGGALFAGLAIILLLTRDAERSPARSAMATGFSVSCAILAALSVYEFTAAHAGVGILAAAAVEAVLALVFAGVRYSDRAA